MRDVGHGYCETTAVESHIVRSSYLSLLRDGIGPTNVESGFQIDEDFLSWIEDTCR
jgi:hypothetical protein